MSLLAEALARPSFVGMLTGDGSNSDMWKDLLEDRKFELLKEVEDEMIFRNSESVNRPGEADQAEKEEMARDLASRVSS
jgi:hypothetical protein